MSFEITSPPEDSIPLDQSCREEESQTRLLATNLARSVLVVQRNFDPHPISYGAYGYCPVQSLHARLGYNGEAHLSSGLYLLGNGNRAYSPTLYRFISPDRTSIFLPGNMNSYAYTAGDPINYFDPNGNMRRSHPKAREKTGFQKPNTQPAAHQRAASTSQVKSDATSPTPENNSSTQKNYMTTIASKQVETIKSLRAQLEHRESHRDHTYTELYKLRTELSITSPTDSRYRIIPKLIEAREDARNADVAEILKIRREIEVRSKMVDAISVEEL